jgi:hypothetical protein
MSVVSALDRLESRDYGSRDIGRLSSAAIAARTQALYRGLSVAEADRIARLVDSRSR